MRGTYFRTIGETKARIPARIPARTPCLFRPLGSDSKTRPQERRPPRTWRKAPVGARGLGPRAFPAKWRTVQLESVSFRAEEGGARRGRRSARSAGQVRAAAASSARVYVLTSPPSANTRTSLVQARAGSLQRR